MNRILAPLAANNPLRMKEVVVFLPTPASFLMDQTHKSPPTAKMRRLTGEPGILVANRCYRSVVQTAFCGGLKPATAG